MKLLDSGHLPSCLGNLETVADQNGPAVHAQDAGVEPEDQSAPDASELAQIQGRTVEEVQQPVVTSRLQTQARTVLVTPSSSLRVVIPARQRAIHKKVLFLAHVDLNWHTRVHQ